MSPGSGHGGGWNVDAGVGGAERVVEMIFADEAVPRGVLEDAADDAAKRCPRPRERWKGSGTVILFRHGLRPHREPRGSGKVGTGASRTPAQALCGESICLVFIGIYVIGPITAVPCRAKLTFTPHIDPVRPAAAAQRCLAGPWGVWWRRTGHSPPVVNAYSEKRLSPTHHRSDTDNIIFGRPSSPRRASATSTGTVPSKRAAARAKPGGAGKIRPPWDVARFSGHAVHWVMTQSGGAGAVASHQKGVRLRAGAGERAGQRLWPGPTARWRFSSKITPRPVFETSSRLRVVRAARGCACWWRQLRRHWHVLPPPHVPNVRAVSLARISHRVCGSGGFGAGAVTEAPEPPVGVPVALSWFAFGRLCRRFLPPGQAAGRPEPRGSPGVMERLARAAGLAEPGGACGGARRRAWARAKAAWCGQAEAMAILIRRTETVTRAPIFSSFSRMVPQVRLASSLCRQADPPQRRHQHVGERREPQAELIGAHRRRRGAVGEQVELAAP